MRNTTKNTKACKATGIKVETMAEADELCPLCVPEPALEESVDD